MATAMGQNPALQKYVPFNITNEVISSGIRNTLEICRKSSRYHAQAFERTGNRFLVAGYSIQLTLVKFLRLATVGRHHRARIKSHHLVEPRIFQQFPEMGFEEQTASSSQANLS